MLQQRDHHVSLPLHTNDIFAAPAPKRLKLVQACQPSESLVNSNQNAEGGSGPPDVDAGPLNWYAQIQARSVLADAAKEPVASEQTATRSTFPDATLLGRPGKPSQLEGALPREPLPQQPRATPSSTHQGKSLFGVGSDDPFQSNDAVPCEAVSQLPPETTPPPSRSPGKSLLGFEPCDPCGSEGAVLQGPVRQLRSKRKRGRRHLPGSCIDLTQSDDEGGSTSESGGQAAEGPAEPPVEVREGLRATPAREVAEKWRRLEGRVCNYPDEDVDALSIHGEELRCLAPGEFLNDTVIEFYMRWLQINWPRTDLPLDACLFLNSFFYKKLKQLTSAQRVKRHPDGPDFWRLRRWTKGIDLLRKQYIFVPIHDLDHWTLAVVCFPEERVLALPGDPSAPGGIPTPAILHLDSLGTRHGGHATSSVTRQLKSYLAWEVLQQLAPRADPTPSATFSPGPQAGTRSHKPLAKARPAFTADQILVKRVPVPLQQNDFDCGLFLLHSLETFVTTAPATFRLADLSSTLQLGRKWYASESASLRRFGLLQMLERLFGIEEEPSEVEYVGTAAAVQAAAQAQAELQPPALNDSAASPAGGQGPTLPSDSKLVPTDSHAPPSNVPAGALLIPSPSPTQSPDSARPASLSQPQAQTDQCAEETPHPDTLVSCQPGVEFEKAGAAVVEPGEGAGTAPVGPVGMEQTVIAAREAVEVKVAMREPLEVEQGRGEAALLSADGIAARSDLAVTKPVPFGPSEGETELDWILAPCPPPTTSVPVPKVEDSGAQAARGGEGVSCRHFGDAVELEPCPPVLDTDAAMADIVGELTHSSRQTDPEMAEAGPICSALEGGGAERARGGPGEEAGLATEAGWVERPGGGEEGRKQDEEVLNGPETEGAQELGAAEVAQLTGVGSSRREPDTAREGEADGVGGGRADPIALFSLQGDDADGPDTSDNEVSGVQSAGGTQELPGAPSGSPLELEPAATDWGKAQKPADGLHLSASACLSTEDGVTAEEGPGQCANELGSVEEARQEFKERGREKGEGVGSLDPGEQGEVFEAMDTDETRGGKHALRLQVDGANGQLALAAGGAGPSRGAEKKAENCDSVHIHVAAGVCLGPQTADPERPDLDLVDLLHGQTERGSHELAGLGSAAGREVERGLGVSAGGGAPAGRVSQSGPPLLSRPAEVLSAVPECFQTPVAPDWETKESGVMEMEGLESGSGGRVPDLQQGEVSLGGEAGGPGGVGEGEPAEQVHGAGEAAEASRKKALRSDEGGDGNSGGAQAFPFKEAVSSGANAGEEGGQGERGGDACDGLPAHHVWTREQKEESWGSGAANPGQPTDLEGGEKHFSSKLGSPEVDKIEELEVAEDIDWDSLGALSLIGELY